MSVLFFECLHSLTGHVDANGTETEKTECSQTYLKMQTQTNALKHTDKKYFFSNKIVLTDAGVQLR